MKNLLHPSLILILIFSMSLGHAQSLRKNKKVIGNGDVTTQTITTSGYDGIASLGFIDVELVNGAEGQINVTTDSNLQEYIEIEVKDNVLKIKTKDRTNLSTKKGVKVTVPVESISKIQLTGSGNLRSAAVIKANEFKLNVTGSGDAVLAIEASEVEARIAGSGNIDLSGSFTDLELSVAGSGTFKGTGLSSKSTEVSIAGSGDVKLSGTTSQLDLKISGSGNFHGFDLNANQTKVMVAGSGDAQVVAQQDIYASVVGSGSVVYKGNPDQKEFKKTGTGKISKQ
jgi:hypothetical protein